MRDLQSKDEEIEALLSAAQELVGRLRVTAERTSGHLRANGKTNGGEETDASR